MNSRFQPLPRATDADHPALPPVVVADLERALARTDALLRGYMLVQDGTVTAEKHWEPYAAEDMVWVYSISKMFTSTAVGFAVAEGLLNVDDRLVDIFPDKAPAEISPRLAALTLHHALSMSTGHAEDTALTVFLSGAPEWEKAFFALPIEHDPGTFFCYNSGASYMLAAAVERVTGQGLVEYLTPRLFEPLGFGPVEWDRSPAGTAVGGWGLMIRLEDLAKLGELYRRGGEWNGTQILDPEWVRAASTTQSDNSTQEWGGPDWHQGYGYQFWMCRHGSYRGDGAYGQYCVVLPEQRAVLALMSEVGEMQPVLDAVWETLLPELSREPVQAVPARSFALEGEAFDGVTFEIADDGLLTLSFSGPDGDAVLQAGDREWVDSTSRWPFGAWVGLPWFFPERPTPISAYYRRTGPDTYEIEWIWRDTPHRNTAVIGVGQEGITVTFPARYHGERLACEDVTFEGTAL